MQLRNVFLSFRGRIPRSTFWYATITLWTAFIILFVTLEAAVSRSSTLLLYLPFFWSASALSAKRYHDLGKSAAWLLLVLIPILGVMWVAIELGLRSGTRGENRYGVDPLVLDLDYKSVD